MSEIDKNKEDKDRLTDRKTEIVSENGWSEDQQKRGYYYDDACNYEVYKPEDDEKESEEEQ